MAIVKVSFWGVADGSTQPVEFKPGDVVSGDLERVAIAEGWAEKQAAKASKKAKPAPAEDEPAKPSKWYK